MYGDEGVISGMYRYRTLLIALSFIMLVTSTASALDMVVNPAYQKIPIGGNVTYNVKITVSVPGVEIGEHTITIKFEDLDGNLIDKLNGSLSSSQVPVTEIFRNASTIEYKWYANTPGEYDFTLKVWINESATEPAKSGEIFVIHIHDGGKLKAVKAQATAYASPVPELTTATLFGIGLIAVAIVGRKF